MRTKIYYQYFTNVVHSTCPTCLEWHGRISAKESDFPDRADGCERVVLPFPRSELDGRREMEREMRRLAVAEVERRRLFTAASETLSGDPERALTLFVRAATIEVYVAELERLAGERASVLRERPALRSRLREVFSEAFSEKFARRRYERFPEGMRYAQEKAGLARIGELFP